MKSDAKRSPLDRARPLRVAGQSLDEELGDVIYDHVLSPVLVTLFVVLLAGLEWWRYVMNVKPSPWIFTAVAMLFAGYAVIKIMHARQRIKQIRLGRDGERAVAQDLEWFRTSNFFVFHDIPTGDANIDHVLIGPPGVFTIETKTLTKPQRGQCKITIEGGVIRANGQTLDRDPMIQAKAQAGWLKHFLAESQFKTIVQPVVVFPGWFVEPFDMKAAGAWVLETKALSKFIENEPERLTREQTQAIASALRSHIRAQAKP